jgi:hypothetical protein
MKVSLRLLLVICILTALAGTAPGQTTLTLNPLTSFGSRGDGSIQPGDSIGTSPVTANFISISAPGGYGVQPGDSFVSPISTNGFNMRGLTYDPTSGNLIFVDTHSGSGGAAFMAPNAAIYVLDANSGQIIGALNTNGMVSGSYTHVVVGVSDDGVVYVCNQTTASQTTGFKIYRWPSANTNNPNFGVAPVVAYSNIIAGAFGTSGERLGETMDVRGSGTNTQIIVGSSSLNGTGTNIFLFTTADGTNFTPHRISFPGVITTAVFNDGIAFGPTNTFFAKQVGKPFLYLAWDANALATGTNQLTGTVISSFAASSANDPLQNISAIAVDNVNHLLAGLEEIGGTATGGHGKVWLYRILDPTNKPPAILANRVFIANYQKTTAPMGYLRFGNGRLYAHASNNGLLASTVDSTPLSLPSYIWPDFNPDGTAGTRKADLPPTTRVAVGQAAHFEVQAVPDVTSYQWYSNNVAVSAPNGYYLDVPNVQTNASGSVFRVVASNAAGSSNSVASTLVVVSAGNFFHPNLLWSKTANTVGLSDPTNFVTSGGGASTPNERCIAYNALSNQLLVVRGPAAFGSLKIFVLNPDTGAFLYTLKTNGITPAATLTLCGIGVADDGAVYAANVANDASFAVYRWADSGSNTVPVTIFGTNSSAAQSNPIFDLTGSQTYRFGDNLAVHGAGISTEIIMDSQNSTKFASILRPLDGTMTNWQETGYLLQNIQGSYGSEAYGTTIGRGLQFGHSSTFWQKRYNGGAGAPLSQMSYNPGGGLAPLVVANTTAGLYTNGAVAVNSTLSIGAGLNYVGNVSGDQPQPSSGGLPDTLNYYDMTDPSQAVLLSTQNLPGGATGGVHKGNGNAVGQVIFGFNPATGLNYLFAIDGNNGVAAYSLAGGVTPPPKILAQPHNLRILQGSSGSLDVVIDQPATIEWYKGTGSPVDTGVSGTSFAINNAQTSMAGDYFAIATNVNGAVTSATAHVTVSLPNDNYTLSQSWGAVPGNTNSFPYVSSDGGANTPNERAFAYNALSNQLIVVRCPPNSTAYTVWVVDAGSGSNLYTLTTTGVIHEGPSEVSGANAIDLVGAAAADDGALYICSESPNASGGAAGDPTKMFHVFRWADTGPATAPTLVYEGDPSGAAAGLNFRWGDVMTARGSGTNTELLVNSFDGTYGAVLKPTDATMASFTNFWFFDVAGGGSIGRSIQFGPTNSVFEKRKGAPLVYSSYNLAGQSATALLSIDSSTTLGGVAVDTAHNLAAGVDFVGSTTAPLKPDAVALYDITDPTTPMLLQRYNFPVNEVANANVICQTIIVGSKVYSLDANNGLIAFYINPPVNSMILHITPAGANVNLSWGNPLAILQRTSSLNSSTWADLTTAGQTNSVQPASGAGQFYRLIQRR